MDCIKTGVPQVDDWRTTAGAEEGLGTHHYDADKPAPDQPGGEQTGSAPPVAQGSRQKGDALP